MPERPPFRVQEEDARERQYRSLMEGFGRTGGVVTATELARLVQPHSTQAVSKVARWIVSRQVLSFCWCAQTLIPLFQFALPTMRLREEMAGVLPELVDVLDEWALARWFATPNPWLDDAAPADLLATQPQRVRDAARVDRFMARQ